MMRVETIWQTLLTFLNVTTLFYCLVPVVALALVLAHRLAWPFLSRLLYPIASEKVLGNRKVLIPIASLCLSYALIGGHITLDSILKLFG
jgi:hypothetical protein